MKNAILCLTAAVLAVSSANFATAADKAATSELPAALQALDSGQTQILRQEDAEQVRGQWYMGASFPSGDFFFQGNTPAFAVNVITDAICAPCGGGTVGLRFTVGR